MKRLMVLLTCCSMVLSLVVPVMANAKMIQVAGRVFTEQGPMQGATVKAYLTLDDLIKDQNSVASAATDSNGSYEMALAPGEYNFVAVGKTGEIPYMAYHGLNPVFLENENVWLSFLANAVKPPTDQPAQTTLLKGVVTYKNKPVGDAFIAIYRPGVRQLKGLGFRTESINVDGSFALPMPAGEYIVVAKKMMGEKRIRPLKAGDLFCYYPNNPVSLKYNTATEIEIPCYPKNEREKFVDSPRIKSNDYLTLEEFGDGAKYGISGKVVDLTGKPVKGIYVLAHRSHTPVFMMFNVSHGTEYIGETDAEGKYFIPVDAGGEYFIIARNSLGGGPHRGDIYGLYGENAMHSVQFEPGKVVGDIDIVVSAALDDDEVFKKIYAAQKTYVIQDSKTLEDLAIVQDTVWRGNILVTGAIHVKRGVTLTIEPGTVVQFTKLDRDNNGIGDGEISTEGRIVARGTKDKRIIFKSAAANPQPKDWAHILVLSTAAENTFEYCEFRDAFTGIQTHYSTTVISDSLFIKNHEGLRFNRTNMQLTNSTFTENDIGFRFARLEGRVNIHNNLVYGNNVGVLFMRPHVNTVDFEAPQLNIERPLLLNNNIFNNADYNYKIGDRQNLDVTANGNWWGTDQKEKIEERIYDRNDDAVLGTVIYTPFLTEPVPQAGVRN